MNHSYTLTYTPNNNKPLFNNLTKQQYTHGP